uniref:Androgen receptor n=1 Tax=Zeugodacus cucurbitae TaxID=28588 RepID=A0A0A1WLU3_ZEUCU
MSQSISAAPPMHDIPLSGAEERGDATCEADKANNSKANSLKRFFKLTHRRHNGGEEMPTGSCDVLPEDGGEPKDELGKEEADKDGDLDKPKEHARRFNLRLGSVTRIAEHANTANFMHNAPSRHSLKNSISSYWHTVFRRASKKAAKQKSSQNDDDDEGCDDVEEETNDTELDEELHTLPISDDTIEQVTQANK